MNEFKYESPLPVPARSALYSPEPRGLGTGMVESMVSYLERLAESHAVSVADLLCYLISGEADYGTFQSKWLGNLMRRRSGDLNSTQNTARRWNTLVANHTRRTALDQLTLLPWRQLLTTQRLMHSSQMWCPSCLDDWVNAGHTVYWPLLWSLQIVIICPIHRLLLEARCHLCQAEVYPLATHGRAGFCPKCKVWLGFEGRHRSGNHLTNDTPDVTEVAIKMAEGGLALLAASSLVRESVGIKELVRLLEHCLQNTRCGQAALHRRLGLSEVSLESLIYNKARISVRTLVTLLDSMELDVAYFVQTPYTTLIASGRLNGFLRSLPPKGQPAIKSKLKRGQHMTPDVLAEAQATLEAAAMQDEAVNLSALARGLGLTIYVLQRHFPDLCSTITDIRKTPFNLEEARVVLVEILNSAAPPPTWRTITADCKTSVHTLNKYLPDEVAIIRSRQSSAGRVAEVRERLVLLTEAEPYLSVHAISRRLGVHNTYIRKHYPDLHQAIIQRYADYRHACRIERERQEVAAVRAAVLQLCEEGKVPSYMKVAAKLGPNGRRFLTETEKVALAAIKAELGLR